MKKRSICFSLRNREITVYSSKRNDLNILRTLVCHSGREFRKVWTKHSSKTFHYESGRIFSENYRICHYGYNRHGGPSEIYKLPKTGLYDKRKLEDALIYRCFHDEFPAFDSKASLIGLESCDTGESLVQYYLDTGQKVRDIFLSYTVKFKHVSWVDPNELFVVKSKHTAERSRFHMATGISMNIAIVMAVFSVFPLKFIGMFEVDRRVFGSGITNAVLSHGILIVMYITGHVRFYSFDYILDKFKLSEYSLDSAKPEASPGPGYVQQGLPMNIRITECPPVLFEVRCADHDIQIGGNPWHYIITPHSRLGTFQIHSLKDHKKVNNGTLHIDTFHAEPDRCVFHPDNSGRIVHIGAPEVRILALRSESNEEKCTVYLTKSINLQLEDKKEKLNKTSSGRCIKKRKAIDEIDSSQDMVIHQFDHEDDLDLTWISATYHHPALRGVIRIHDNKNLEFLREIELPQQWEEVYEYVVYVDLDTIIQVVKPRLGHFVCTMYRLAGDVPNEEEVADGETSKPSTRRTSRGRTR